MKTTSHTTTDAHPRTLYRHCEGLGSIRADLLNLDAEHTVSVLQFDNDHDDTASRVVIGPQGLRLLAAQLIALADELQGGA